MTDDGVLELHADEVAFALMAARVAAAAHRAEKGSLDEPDRRTLSRASTALRAEARLLRGQGKLPLPDEGSYAFASLTLDAAQAAEPTGEASATGKQLADRLLSIARAVEVVRDGDGDKVKETAPVVARLFSIVADMARSRAALVGDSVDAETPLHVVG